MSCDYFLSSENNRSGPIGDEIPAITTTITTTITARCTAPIKPVPTRKGTQKCTNKHEKESLLFLFHNCVLFVCAMCIVLTTFQVLTVEAVKIIIVSFWSWNSFFNPNFHHKIYITFHFLQAIYIGNNYNIFNPNFNHEFFLLFHFLFTWHFQQL